MHYICVCNIVLFKSGHWNLKSGIQNSWVKVRFTMCHSPSKKRDRMDGIRYRVFKRATIFFYSNSRHLSLCCLTSYNQTYGLWPLLTLLLCSESFHLWRHNLSCLWHIISSLQVLARTGKFHNTFSVSMITNWSFFSEHCILCTAAYWIT